MTEADLAKLAEAMDWVIPRDASPGAGAPACLKRFVELVESQSEAITAQYAASLPGLKEADLADPANPFARMFIDHVRDVYYAYPETGSWSDIGFKVTDP